MLQLSEEGILPALILTKTDLGYNADDFESRLRHVSTKIPVFYTSIEMPETIARLREFISLAETVVFVGMSGVGKIIFKEVEERYETSEVKERLIVVIL